MKKALITLGIILMIGLIGWGIYSLSIFRVSDTSPANGSTISRGQATIVISFNRDIQPVNLENQIISSDNIIYGVSTNKNQLIIQTRDLKLDTKYSIALKNITSTKNEVIKLYTYTFTNKYVAYNEQSKSQQDQQLQNQGKGNIEDIALQVLPISTDTYYISSELLDQPQGDKKIKIIIALLITDQQTTNTGLVRQYKQQALDFLKQKGINLDNYVVEYSPPEAANL